MDTTYRHWLMLRMIPRYPCKIDGAKIEERLKEEGYPTGRRTIQRDLDKLSAIFPLLCDNQTKPYGWSWKTDAPAFEIPNMEPSAALMFRMADQHLARMLPAAVRRSLHPYVQNAEKALDRIARNGLRAWPDKVRTISRGQPLLSAMIKPGVMEAVCEAVLEERRLKIVYRKKGEKGIVEYEASPLGLVFRDQVVYLVATLWDYENPLLLLLHRMESAEILRKIAVPPVGFDFRKYTDRELNFPEGEKPFRLELKLAAEIAVHLSETPLSEDQEMIEKADGRVLVRATVADTAQLRWWLLGFGSQVEVLKPKKLRKEFQAIAEAFGKTYSSG